MLYFYFLHASQVLENKCFDRSKKVKIPALLENDKPDGPADQKKDMWSHREVTLSINNWIMYKQYCFKQS